MYLYFICTCIIIMRVISNVQPVASTYISIFNETKHFMSIKNRQRPSFRSRWKDSICCSEQMIDEGNLLRFVQVRPTIVCHMLAPMSWPMSSWNHRMKGRAMSHPLRTWVARPALCCYQMPYFMDDPDRFSEAGQKHWPELMETHSEYPTSRCDFQERTSKKNHLYLRNPWHLFVKKLKKIWGGAFFRWTFFQCKVVPQLMEITWAIFDGGKLAFNTPRRKVVNIGTIKAPSGRLDAWKLEDFRNAVFPKSSNLPFLSALRQRWGPCSELDDSPSCAAWCHQIVDVLARKDGRFHQRLTVKSC